MQDALRHPAVMALVLVLIFGLGTQIPRWIRGGSGSALKEQMRHLPAIKVREPKGAEKAAWAQAFARIADRVPKERAALVVFGSPT